jgi:hypothetical protein
MFMTAYSTANDIQKMTKALGPSPLFVCDMDGNVLNGYTLAVESMAFAGHPHTATQSIPPGTPLATLEQMVKDGALEKKIFAARPLDVRLPSEIVDALNEYLDRGEAFKISFLTSRRMEDALFILRESGVKNYQDVMLCADSGAVLRVNGGEKILKPLSLDEKNYLKEINVQANQWQAEIDALVRNHNGGGGVCAPLLVEEKGIGTTVHYRAILEQNGAGEGSALDIAIRKILSERMNDFVIEGPIGNNGPAFKTLPAPASEEIKIKGVDKSHGLAAILKEAKKANVDISSFVFSGDDMAHAKGQPGTDYYAAIAVPRLAGQYNIPGFVVHTHHKSSDSNTPDPDKGLSRLFSVYAQPKIDLVLPDPAANVSFMLSSLKAQKNINTSSEIKSAPAAAL